MFLINTEQNRIVNIIIYVTKYILKNITQSVYGKSGIAHREHIQMRC